MGLVFALWKGGYVNYVQKGDVFFLHKLAADLQERIDDDWESRNPYLRWR